MQVTYRFARQFEYRFLKPPNKWPSSLTQLPPSLPLSSLQKLRADILQQATIDEPSFFGG